MNSPYLRNLFALAKSANEAGEPQIGLREAAMALDIDYNDAKDWAFAMGLPARSKAEHGQTLVTMKQVEALAEDPEGKKALRNEVARLRKLVRMHEGMMQRRAEAEQKRLGAQEARRAEISKLRERNKSCK